MERDPGFVALRFELFTSGRRNPEIAAEFAALQRVTREPRGRAAGRQASARAWSGSTDAPEAVAAVLLSLADGLALQPAGRARARSPTRHLGAAATAARVTLIAGNA